MPGRWLHGALIGLALWSAPTHTSYARGATPGDFPGKITLQDGSLTARIATVPLRQVMEEISRLSGAQVRWLSQQGEGEPVSVEFTALPFSEAMRQILREQNFMLFYTVSRGEPRLIQIWISAKGKAEEQSVVMSQPVESGETALRAEEPVKEIAQPLEVVIQTALSDEDLASRLSAIEYLGEHAQEDLRVREVLSRLARSDSNPQVQDIASAVLGTVE